MKTSRSLPIFSWIDVCGVVSLMWSTLNVPLGIILIYHLTICIYIKFFHNNSNIGVNFLFNFIFSCLKSFTWYISWRWYILVFLQDTYIYLVYLPGSLFWMWVSWIALWSQSVNDSEYVWLPRSRNSPGKWVYIWLSIVPFWSFISVFLLTLYYFNDCLFTPKQSVDFSPYFKWVISILFDLFKTNR